MSVAKPNIFKILLTVWLAHFPLLWRFIVWWRSPASWMNDLPHLLQECSVFDGTSIKHLSFWMCSANAWKSLMNFLRNVTVIETSNGNAMLFRPITIPRTLPHERVRLRLRFHLSLIAYDNDYEYTTSTTQFSTPLLQ